MFTHSVCILALLMMLANASFATSSHGKPFIKLIKSKEDKSIKRKGLIANRKYSNLLLRGGQNSDQKSFDWRYFVAGGICAATSHGITTPIDVVKTRMQQDPERYKEGVVGAAKDIVMNEGPLFLLSGLGPTIVGYGLEGALKFGFYESFKKVFAKCPVIKQFYMILASLVAGAVASLVLCPMEMTRIKMVGNADWAKENLVSGIMRLIREDGAFSSFGGFPAMLSKQIPYTMGKQMSFDIVKKFLYSTLPSLDFMKKLALDTKWTISLLSAIFASIIACLSSQPGDMILTKTYESSKDHAGFSNIVSSIYSGHGIPGFFFGLQARIAHVASIITSQLVLYDIVKAALGLSTH